MVNLQKLLAKVLSAFTIKETAIDTTDFGVNVYKRCGIVYLRIFTKSTKELTKNTWLTVGTLPDGYRPQNIVDAVVIENNTASVAYYDIIRILTSGEIRLWVYSGNTTNNEIRGYVTFISSGGYNYHWNSNTFSRRKVVGAW